MTGLELWAGAECTVNRVGDRYSDQVRRTGHHDRLDDMDRLAALGARRVRFPVLWERVAPERLEDADFSWSDARLERLQRLGVEPIVGLVHHGSGPAWTSLAEESFVSGLSRYAARVAERYPWVDSFTPVNEPLTTARFAGLYGHWYPHGRSTAIFLRLLLIQVRAVREAMRAIRRVNPRARLVQTEDFGRTFSTPALAYQSRYENLRRWLSFDLLFGRVDRHHPLREHLEKHGIDRRVLDELAFDPCPPDIIGINYYLTSDRFLDERRDRYPTSTWGGNGRHSYADVEAVRVLGKSIAGHRRVIDETAARYRTALAITEAHVGCTREEQLRWFAEAWDAARAARSEGVDVRAVTLWSAFGAVDWSSLVTRERGDYEPGAYDIRGPSPRPTALAKLARNLSQGESVDVPTLAEPGWWWTSRRLLYPAFGSTLAKPRSAPARPLLILGNDGLARAAERSCNERAVRATRRERLDPTTLSSLTGSGGPWAVVIAALPGTSLDWLSDSQLENVALACNAARLPLVMFSSELVFEGSKNEPYVESDAPDPRLATGHLCWRRERAVLAACSHALVIRTGLLFGGSGPDDALTRALWRLARGQRVHSAADVRISPAYVPHVMTVAIDLLVDGEAGIWHLAPANMSTPFELLRAAADASGVPTTELTSGEDARFHALPWRPMRALTSERGAPLPDLGAAVSAFVAESGASTLVTPDAPSSSSGAEMVFPSTERLEPLRASSDSR